MGKTPTLLDPIKTANLSHWSEEPNTVGVSLPSPEDGNRIPDDGQSPEFEFRSFT
jgi:hypothetical protein